MFFVTFIVDELVHATRATIIEGTSGIIIYITRECFINLMAGDFTDAVTDATFKY